MNLIKEKVGDFSIGEAFAVGIAKMLGEQLLSPVIGNGKIMSGLIKIGGAYVIPKYVLKNQVGKVAGTALAVDGVEDILTDIFSGGLTGSRSDSAYI